MVRGFLIWIVYASSISVVFAAEDSLVILPDEKSYRLKPYCSYRVDTMSLSFAEVLKSQFSASYDPNDYSREGLGFWVRFSVVNQSEWSNFILTIDQWSKATLYYKSKSGEWTTFESGTMVPVSERPESIHRLLSFPLIIDPGTSQTYYLYVENKVKLTRNYSRLYNFLDKMELEEAGFARRKFLANQLVITFVMGISFILLVYSLALFIQNREPSFLFLALYLLLSSLFIANIHGITTNYLLWWIQAFELPMGLVFAHLVSISLALFVKYFLHLTGRTWQHMAIWLLVGFLFVSMLVSLIEQRSMWYFPRRYLELIVLLAVLVWGAYKRHQGASFLLTAITATAIASFISDTLAVRSTPLFVFSDIFYLSGLTLQMILFSVGSSTRLNSLQAEVLKVQREKRMLLQDQNKILNEQVMERTGELEKAYQSISLQNEELHIQTESLNKAYEQIQKLNLNLEQEVDIRTERLESTLKELDLFLYRSSHDMRRPLTTILGLVNLIRFEKNPEEIRYLNQKIEKTVLSLDQMLQKLMMISTITDIPRSPEEINVKDLLDRIFWDFQKQFKRNNFHFTLEIGRNVRLRVQSELLVTALKCLIENAILYGYTERTVVHAVVSSEGDFMRIIIRDNGQGIHPEYIDNVFDMYFRANEQSQGNGLGLYVVKKCVERLGGTVTLNSTVGHGTTVEILLPGLLQEGEVS